MIEITALFMWAALGLNGLIIMVVGLALIMFFGQLRGSRRS